FAVYLETLDDVVFDTSGAPTELLQLKHHCERAANLTDASPDIWKSLRVWVEGRAAGTIPDDARLFLITTAAAGNGSAASYLAEVERDENKALERLRATAASSTSEGNKLAYQLFKRLSQEQQEQLVHSVTIICGAATIN